MSIDGGGRCWCAYYLEFTAYEKFLPVYLFISFPHMYLHHASSVAKMVCYLFPLWLIEEVIFRAGEYEYMHVHGRFVVVHLFYKLYIVRKQHGMEIQIHQ